MKLQATRWPGLKNGQGTLSLLAPGKRSWALGIVWEDTLCKSFDYLLSSGKSIGSIWGMVRFSCCWGKLTRANINKGTDVPLE
ncbi:hypothetical protein KM043_013725 [Ampulex compressa]|nr:hypothetical protein KM043_013725 [Ampulex compressa]